MKVSIITVCLNSADSIRETIRSIEEQDYNDIEHIIVDGGSEDGTLEIIQNPKNTITQWISEPDNGIYDAMNKGLFHATGELVVMLNAGDVYPDSTIVSQMEAFIRNHKLDAAYGDLVYSDHGKANPVIRYWKAGEYRKGAFRRGWAIPHPTFFCKKKIYDQYGFFRDELQIAADFELILRFVEKYRIHVGYLPKIIVKMRAGGLSQNFFGIVRGNMEILRSFLLNDMSLPFLFFFTKPFLKISQLLKKDFSPEHIRGQK